MEAFEESVIHVLHFLFSHYEEELTPSLDTTSISETQEIKNRILSLSKEVDNLKMEIAQLKK